MSTNKNDTTNEANVPLDPSDERFLSRLAIVQDSLLTLGSHFFHDSTVATAREIFVRRVIAQENGTNRPPLDTRDYRDLASDALLAAEVFDQVVSDWEEERAGDEDEDDEDDDDEEDEDDEE